MLTADCPVGLRRIRRRLGIWAGLVIAAWLTICLFGLTSAKGSRGKEAIFARLRQINRRVLQLGA